jgi:RNA polymerase sigma factor (sigma-70 family)
LRYSELEPIIANGYSEGRVRFGDLGLDLHTYTERVYAIVHKYFNDSSSKEAIVSFVKGLHGRDLYLATACVQHSLKPGEEHAAGPLPERASQAWKTLELTYKGFIHNLSRFFFRKGFVANDLADNILADLFLPDRSGASRIASYDGRSSLSTWLRVVIYNRAVNAQRSNATMQSVEILTDIPDQPALESIDSGLQTQRYHTQIADSLAAACQDLTLRERLLLLWRYEDGLLLGDIARPLGIHQSNVTRQLERVQMKVRERVVRILTTQHGLDPDAIKECLRAIAENPHTIAILDPIKPLKGAANRLHLIAQASRAPTRQQVLHRLAAQNPTLNDQVKRKAALKKRK